ncbi:hypothetical protein ILUMI_01095 [Ignelater luminosus]|uniref:Uncharacterized protein n=1 Tax=Ignelater luminosus TaxID=2038154 RepID=A0A8K0DJ03_IGNLU|nr:hypothetical protein ILUMI_01095 [Ignelater luminosus]
MLKPGRVYILYVPEITGFVSEGPDLYSDFTAIKPLLWLLFMIDSPESKIVTQDGDLLNEAAEVLKRWREHFNSLLSGEIRNAATELSNEEPEQEETVPTKYTMSATSRAQRINLEINNDTVEMVEEFCYLGSLMRSPGRFRFQNLQYELGLQPGEYPGADLQARPYEHLDVVTEECSENTKERELKKEQILEGSSK